MYDEDVDEQEHPVPSLNLNLPIETTSQFAHRLNWMMFMPALELSFLASLWWAVLSRPPRLDYLWRIVCDGISGHRGLQKINAHASITT